MASRIFKRGPTTPQMNMTSLIDVTFLLIIFFMLVNNIITEENVEMIVPELEDSKARELGEVHRLVVNVAPQPFDPKTARDNPLMRDGTAAMVQLGMDQYPMADLASMTADLTSAAEASPKDGKGRPTLEVVLRADSALYYNEVQAVMSAITAANIAKVNLVAFTPEKTKRDAKRFN